MKKHPISILFFVIFYTLFVIFFNFEVKEYPEIIVSSVFFFGFFTGFFISRQSERYSKILEIISNTDGNFSFLYRISSLIPEIHGEVREIIRRHYQKIEESGNWAYHILNPSVTITTLTKTFSKVPKEKASLPQLSAAYTNIWGAIQQLQEARKKTILFYHQKLLPFQWAIVFIFWLILIFSIDLLPTDNFLMDIIKVILGTSAFLVLLLLKQLDNLEIFGKDFAKKSAKDIFRILDEKDIEEIKIISPNLVEKL